MSDLRLPCAEGRADDWFIGADGKQYRSDEFLTFDQQQQILNDLVEDRGGVGFHDDSILEDAQKALAAAEADARTAALQRRRHAKEACYTSCPVRLQCLQVAIDTDERHGTWGGYYEEEIAQIQDAIKERRRRRAEAEGG